MFLIGLFLILSFLRVLISSSSVGNICRKTRHSKQPFTQNFYNATHTEDVEGDIKVGESEREGREMRKIEEEMSFQAQSVPSIQHALQYGHLRGGYQRLVPTICTLIRSKL